MGQKSKTASGVPGSINGEGVSAARSHACGAAAAEDEMHALSAEIVGLLNEQAFSAGAAHTEREVCESFSNILLRRWNLCSVATFLRGDDGRLRPCTNLDRKSTRLNSSHDQISYAVFCL